MNWKSFDRKGALVFIAALLLVYPFVGIAPVLLVFPFVAIAAYYAYPLYRKKREKYEELFSSFILSTLIASYAYIYRDIVIAIKKALNTYPSKFSRLVRSSIWEHLTKGGRLKSYLSTRKAIMDIDPSFPDVLSIIEATMEKGEIRKALDFHAEHIFSRIINRVRSAVNPIRIVFAVVVVMPVFLLILLPLGVIFLPQTMSVVNMFALFNIILPAVAALSLALLSVFLPSKPSFTNLGDVKIYIALSLVLLVLITIASAFLDSVKILALFLAASIVFYAFVFLKERKRVEEIEKNYSLLSKLPAFFATLSKDLERGIPFERAIINAEKKEEIDVNASSLVLGKDELSFSKVFSSYSPFLSALREAATKNLAKEVSEVFQYFFKLKEAAEEKVKSINEETIHTAKLLLSFIIPIVSSVSAAFSDSLETILKAFSFSQIDFINIPHEPFSLTLVLSLYIVQMSAILTFFLLSLEGKRDKLYGIYKAAENTVKALGVYVVFYFLSLYVINFFSGIA